MYVSIAGVSRVVLQQQCSCAYECIQTAYSITRTALRKKIIRETPRWRSKTWDRTTCFAAAAAAERRITRTVSEKDQGGRETREAREKKRKEKKRLRHVYVCTE